MGPWESHCFLQVSLQRGFVPRIRRHILRPIRPPFLTRIYITSVCKYYPSCLLLISSSTCFHTA
jgi:hypothetical protein